MARSHSQAVGRREAQGADGVKHAGVRRGERLQAQEQNRSEDGQAGRRLQEADQAEPEGHSPEFDVKLGVDGVLHLVHAESEDPGSQGSRHRRAHAQRTAQPEEGQKVQRGGDQEESLVGMLRREQQAREKVQRLAAGEHVGMGHVPGGIGEPERPRRVSAGVGAVGEQLVLMLEQEEHQAGVSDVAQVAAVEQRVEEIGHAEQPENQHRDRDCFREGTARGGGNWIGGRKGGRVGCHGRRCRGPGMEGLGLSFFRHYGSHRNHRPMPSGLQV